MKRSYFSPYKPSLKDLKPIQKDKLIETQKKYDLKIPFGHDVGNENTGSRSSTMYHYRTGGTPWFIFIDQNDIVVFNDFLNEEKAIEYLKGIE